MVLFPHNESAYSAVANMLEINNRAAVVHPTGTGKSYIAFQLVEDFPNATFLWLAPNDYIFESQCRNLNSGLPANWRKQVTFMTYAKLMRLSQHELDQLAPDFIILDEFHRCGAYCWGVGVQKLLNAYPMSKVLGLSATPIRYLDNCRNMAEELFTVRGKLCVASEMTLGEAIVRGILPTPRYVTTMLHYQEELLRYQKRIDTFVPAGMKANSQQYLDTLRRTLHEAEGLDGVLARHLTDSKGKYILFCSDWEHLQQVKENIRVWFSCIDAQPHCYSLYSGDPNTDKEYAAFLADQSDHLKLLLCINRLNEGIHISDISGVILFRPTTSPILYKQQIGRALTSGNGGTPLILDVVNNFDSLLSIGTIRTEMTNAVYKLRAEGNNHLIKVENFEVLEQVENGAQLVRDLENTLNNTWDMWYGEACAYYLAHGNLKVPKRYITDNGMQLGVWIQAQRAVYSGTGKGTLSQEHVEALNNIGMIWDNMRDNAWNEAYEIAKEYFDLNGNLAVSDSCLIGSFDFGKWISYMRIRKKNGKLPAERIDKLNAIGMIWDAMEAKWEQHFAQAKDYYKEHGDLNIPSSFRTDDGFLLGMWVANQKKAKSSARKPLTQDQVMRLSEIGMSWQNTFDAQWQDAYRLAEEYYQFNGNLNIPYIYCTASGFKLGKWLARQRSAKRNPGKDTNCVLTSERIAKLEKIGVVWDAV